jgi:hypothetical protein
MMITTAASLVMLMLSADELGVIKSPTARGASGGMMTAIVTGGTEITVARAGGISTGGTEITTAVPFMGALLIVIAVALSIVTAVRATEPGATGTSVEITFARDGMIGITTVATVAMTEADWTTKMIAGHRQFRRLQTNRTVRQDAVLRWRPARSPITYGCTR